MVFLKEKYSFRIGEWWHSKIAMLFGWAYFFSMVSNQTFVEFLTSLPFLIIWYISAAAFGYFINDWFDIELDNSVGKSNGVKSTSIFNRFVITFLLVLLQIGSFSFFVHTHQANAIWYLFPLVEIGLFFLYSFPKIRLKERPYWDVVCDASYAQIIPIFITWLAICGMVFTPLLGLVLFWALCSGIRNIGEHQLLDFDFDKKGGVKNLIQTYGYYNALHWQSKIRVVEIASFFLFLSFVGINIPWFFVSFSFVGLGLFMLLPLGENILNQIPSSESNQSKTDIRIFYESGLFLSTSFAFFFIGKPIYLTILPLQVILFKNESFQLFAKFIWHRIVLGILFYQVFLKLWILFKIIVNYLIYYFRKYILFYDEFRARGGQEPNN